MYRFQRIMVGLDFSLMDRNLIEYVAFMAQQIQPQKIYFTNIQSNLAVPDMIVKEFPQFREPLDEKLIKEMKDKVTQFFPSNDQFDISYEVVEGSPTKELLHRIEIKNIDLLIMGRKSQLPGLGIVPKQIARSCKSSVLFVPEGSIGKIEQIMVPIDFSTPAKKALEVAIDLAEVNGNIPIWAINIYDLPRFSHGISWGVEKMEPIMRESMAGHYNEFIELMETKEVPINPLFKLNMNYAGAAIAYEEADRKNVDLLVTGSHGKTGFNRWILGSFTEKLISLDTNIPLLVLKKRQDPAQAANM